MIFPIAIAFFLLIVLQSSESETMTQNNFDDLFKKYAAKYGLDWKMLKAIAIIESSLGRASSVAYGLKNPSDTEKSKSTDGLSWGLMQVTLTTARDYDSNATAQRLNNPEYSVDLASRHLKMLINLFKNDANQIEKVVKSYNQGQGATMKNKPYADGYWIKYQNAYKTI